MTKIELRKDERRSDPIQGAGKSYKLNPGGFDVYVDGAHWGRITTESKGPNGIEYTLCQMSDGRGNGRACTREVPTELNPRFNHGKTTRTVCYTAWSDKVYLRRLPPGNTAIPLADRLMSLATLALEQGALRDPAAVAEEAKAASASYRAKQEAAKAERRAKLEAKAGEILAPFPDRTVASVQIQLTNAIVDLMEWAQSH